MHAAQKNNTFGSLVVRVKTRVARASYGTCSAEVWDPTKHDEADKVWHEVNQAFHADNQMRWFIKQVCETISQPKNE